MLQFDDDRIKSKACDSLAMLVHKNEEVNRTVGQHSVSTIKQLLMSNQNMSVIQSALYLLSELSVQRDNLTAINATNIQGDALSRFANAREVSIQHYRNIVEARLKERF